MHRLTLGIITVLAIGLFVWFAGQNDQLGPRDNQNVITNRNLRENSVRVAQKPSKKKPSKANLANPADDSANERANEPAKPRQIEYAPQKPQRASKIATTNVNPEGHLQVQQTRYAEDLPAGKHVQNHLQNASDVRNQNPELGSFIDAAAEQQNQLQQQADAIKAAIQQGTQNGEDIDIPAACLTTNVGLSFTPDNKAQLATAEVSEQSPEQMREQLNELVQTIEQMKGFESSHQTSLEHGSSQGGILEPSQFNPHANASKEAREAMERMAALPKRTGVADENCADQQGHLLSTEVDPHLAAFSKTKYPSATECRACHEQIFNEWASSSHAYASLSPMFHKFEQRLNELAQGTVGYFCLRCHAPVATTMELRRDQPIYNGPRVFREGVTCVACHRVKENYGKVNGNRRMEPGDITSPVYGSGDGLGVEEAIKHKDYFKVKTDIKDKKQGQHIHRRAVKFEQLSKSSFCVSCHQVAVAPGIKLEVVWDQYRASPAYRDGTTCQDCHMGKVPGVDAGYTVGPAALINGKAVKIERRHSNHMFYGPGYSIAHPGIFPHNPDADRWTPNQWLQFDWRSGWGTEAFEDKVESGEINVTFPKVWENIDDRFDARDIITDNLKKLRYKKDIRRQVMENGSRVTGPYFIKQPSVGRALSFHYDVCNTNPGHNMPSGSLGAQPQLWLNVVLINPNGERVWETGHMDSLGDLHDIHSEDVLRGRAKLDAQLFNLQTKFLITNLKGTDREMPLPVNTDIDQLPFIRPGGQPITNINHPPFIRMEGHSIPPLSSRHAKYKIPASAMSVPGTYRLSARLRSRAEPMYFMRFVRATPEMMRSMNEWVVDAHPQTVVFEVK